jgi:hypothetical protein
MVTKIAATLLFLFFLFFVNLAATVATSMNRIETSVIASLASIFQLVVDAGAILIVGFLLLRAFVKLTQRAEAAHQRRQTRQPAYRYMPVQPDLRSNQNWDNAQPQPLPFDDHNPTVVVQQPEFYQVEITPAESVLVQNIHRMRQQRGGYRMVR